MPSRKKYENVNNAAIRQIIRDLNSEQHSVQYIANKYEWSKSTIYNIKR